MNMKIEQASSRAWTLVLDCEKALENAGFQNVLETPTSQSSTRWVDLSPHRALRGSRDLGKQFAHIIVATEAQILATKTAFLSVFSESVSQKVR